MMKRSQLPFALPGDLEQFAKKAQRKLHLKWAILIMFTICVLIGGGYRIFDQQTTWPQRIFFMCIAAAFYIITFLTVKFFDRNFYGKLKCVTLQQSTLPVIKPELRKNYLNVTLRLECKKQKITRYNIRNSIDSRTYYEAAFQTGDEVFHLAGTKHAIALPRTNETHVQCAVCANLNEKNEKNCSHCGHTLITERIIHPERFDANNSSVWANWETYEQ